LSWTRPFDDPIKPPEGRPILALKDAAAYIMKLPKAERIGPAWQATAEALIMAAELHGAKPIPEATPSRAYWGRRKLKRRSDPAPMARPRVTHAAALRVL
jgi:hypothetical protein